VSKRPIGTRRIGIDVRYTPNNGHFGSSRKESAFDPKRTFVELPNLHFFTPELIHAPERIGVLEFKLVPQVKRG
jgi:hypothetical protein